jgi:uncharacterized coiled-coil protein SlyX
LSEEFRFELLAEDCETFAALHRTRPEASIEDALSEQLCDSEERMLFLERRSAVLAETVRSLCEQMANRESEVNRLCGSLDKLFQGEQAYRRGCECLYQTNGFGLRGEEMAKTLGLSFLKQSADLGNSDGQYLYGRCLLYGEGCAADPDLGIKYLRQSMEQGNSRAEAEYRKCPSNVTFSRQQRIAEVRKRVPWEADANIQEALEVNNWDVEDAVRVLEITKPSPENVPVPVRVRIRPLVRDCPADRQHPAGVAGITASAPTPPSMFIRERSPPWDVANGPPIPVVASIDQHITH